MGNIVKSKLLESFQSVLPIALIIAFLAVTLTPMSASTFLLFVFGVVCLVIGLSLFTTGAEMSMQTIGAKIGTSLAQSGKVWLITLVSFLIGIFVTIAEPDLQILADQVSAVNSWLLILAVSAGVGIFLIIAMLRIVFHFSLSWLLIGFYTLAVGLCFLVSPDFWALAFDSGGVTTGPMTVPFIMSIGAGVAGIRTTKSEHDDAFGLVSLCSVGPIIAVMALGICFSIEDLTYEVAAPIIAEDTAALTDLYVHGFTAHAGQIAIALLPIIVFAILFQLITHAFTAHKLLRIGMGLVYTFVGLVIFLTGANEGFLPVGQELGRSLALIDNGWLLIPVGMLLGYFIVNAEPAVYVLNKQVEQITAGAVSAGTMRLTLSIGVASALGLSMLRVLTGIPILYILIPGYVIALGLTFFVPKFFVGIAFDSGGVASGAMMSAFVLPLAIGACVALRGNTLSVMTDAFGCVAFVALTPIISIQICGLLYTFKSKQAVSRFIAEKETFIEYSIPRRADANGKKNKS